MKKRKKLLLTLFIAAVLFHSWQQPSRSRTLSVYEKIQTKQDIQYLIIGDSIGRGAGVDDRAFTWFEQWEQLMKTKFGVQLKRHSIVQSGATAYEGLYLFKKAKKPASIDLAFIIFGENDRKYMNGTQFAFYYESLIREMKQLYPEAEIITITESCLNEEHFAQKIKHLSSHYHTNHIDMRISFRQKQNKNTLLTSDGVHPNQQGYQLYAEEIYNALYHGILKSKQPAYLANPITTKQKGHFTEIKYPHVIQGNFIKSNDYFLTQENGASLSYIFKGNNLGVNTFVGREGGMMAVYIDGKFIRNISTWWPIPKNRTLYVASGLTNEEHVVTFTFTGKAPASKSVKQPTMSTSSIVIFN